MPAFPWPLPLNAYVGLGVGLLELKGALGYVREPVTMETSTDNVTVSNLNTLEWPTAMSDWGPVTSVLLYDAPTGGNLLFSLLLAGSATPYSYGAFSAGLYSPTTPSPLVVSMYDRLRISASSMSAEAAGTEESMPTGWGRGAFGRFGYGTIGPGFATGFGLYGYGQYGYGTAATVEGFATAILKTFAVTYPCEAGSWAPGPYARAA